MGGDNESMTLELDNKTDKSKFASILLDMLLRLRSWPCEGPLAPES